jgi:hypothetical protein
VGRAFVVDSPRAVAMVAFRRPAIRVVGAQLGCGARAPSSRRRSGNDGRVPRGQRRRDLRVRGAAALLRLEHGGLDDPCRPAVVDQVDHAGRADHQAEEAGEQHHPAAVRTPARGAFDVREPSARVDAARVVRQGAPVEVTGRGGATRARQLVGAHDEGLGGLHRVPARGVQVGQDQAILARRLALLQKAAGRVAASSGLPPLVAAWMSACRASSRRPPGLAAARRCAASGRRGAPPWPPRPAARRSAVERVEHPARIRRLVRRGVRVELGGEACTSPDAKGVGGRAPSAGRRRGPPRVAVGTASALCPCGRSSARARSLGRDGPDRALLEEVRRELHDGEAVAVARLDDDGEGRASVDQRQRARCGELGDLLRVGEVGHDARDLVDLLVGRHLAPQDRPLVDLARQVEQQRVHRAQRVDGRARRAARRGHFPSMNSKRVIDVWRRSKKRQLVDALDPRPGPALRVEGAELPGARRRGNGPSSP